jgi:hypothetical protein
MSEGSFAFEGLKYEGGEICTGSIQFWLLRGLQPFFWLQSRLRFGVVMGRHAGAKDKRAGRQEQQPPARMQGTGGATPEASAASSTAACAIQGGVTAHPVTQEASATCCMKGESAACAMHGGSAACAVHGASAASSMVKGQGSSVFLKSYFEMRSLLAQDKVKGLDKLSESLAKETSTFRKKLATSSKDQAATEQLNALKDIENAASAMKTSSLESARESFKGLSHSILEYVKSYGCDGSVYSFYCDMVKESWLQETEKVGNPYYGSKMLKCGVLSGHTIDGRFVAGQHEAMGGKHTMEKQEPMDMGHMNH